MNLNGKMLYNKFQNNLDFIKLKKNELIEKLNVFL